ncbi:hypothetical protein CAEBREN_22416 [Caenorhabditis brenneri]|uniref:Uncharacterized protein n=1 Tax=Caenorhabditis brenneri TaxID=135651 RepID=G0NYY3_CAEBE|nr:hypothetical protein CAEBREN_22416 [Caenorhabditis brenneri]
MLSSEVLNSTTSTSTTTTMQPISTLNYTENDEIIGLIVFINLVLTCCLMISVAYNREVFCFSKKSVSRGKKKKKASKGKNHNGEPWEDDDDDDEDFDEI